MARLQQFLISFVVLGGLAAGPAVAGSSASSASSEGASASVGSSSTSVEKSSMVTKLRPRSTHITPWKW